MKLNWFRILYVFHWWSLLRNGPNDITLIIRFHVSHWVVIVFYRRASSFVVLHVFQLRNCSDVWISFSCYYNFMRSQTQNTAEHIGSARRIKKQKFSPFSFERFTYTSTWLICQFLLWMGCKIWMKPAQALNTARREGFARNQNLCGL